eukprot:10412995-Alexandrium_andersonii.AAC.1
MLHCIQRARVLGNPRLYQTFRDEALNSALKKSLRLCHQLRWEHMALCIINSLLARSARSQRARLA